MLTIVLLLSLLCCVPGAAASEARDEINLPIRIGVPWCETGKYENEGKQLKAGYELWQNAVNAGDAGGISVAGKQRKVVLLFVNDQSDPTINSEVTRRLITNDKVDALFSSYSSEITQETLKVANELKIPLISAGASGDFLFKKNGYIASVLIPASQYLHSTLQLFKENSSAKTVSLVYEESPFAIAAKNGGVQSCNQLGFVLQQQLASPLYDAMVQKDPVKQVQAQKKINELVHELGKQHSDVVLSVGHFYDDERFFMALSEQHVNPSALVFTIGPAVPEFIQRFGAAAEGVISPAHWNSLLPSNFQDKTFGTAVSYAKRFRAEYGWEPNYINAAASAAGLAYQTAVAKAKTTAGEKVMPELRKVDIMTFYGKIMIDATGKNVGGHMVVSQIQNGKLVIVGPAQYATGKLVYPRPAWKRVLGPGGK